MQLNGVNLVDRNNRPTVLSRVGLVAYFINDGIFQDPIDISGVTIVRRSDNLTPNTVMDANILTSSLTEDQILMHFTASANEGGGAALRLDKYQGTVNTASGIFRTNPGTYVCVHDGILGDSVSGFYDFYGSSLTVQNSVDAVGEYLDIWTVKLTEGSNYVSIINNFELFDDTFVVLTEPPVFNVQTRLTTKHISLSSVENLRFTNTITIANRDIDNSIKNIFKDSSILQNVQVKIEKINEDSTVLPNFVTIQDYTTADLGIRVTSDNTVLYKFDTTNLITHPNIALFSGITGTYRATLKYSIFDETIITQPYYFTIS